MSGVNLNDRLGTTMTGTISGGGGLTYTGPGRLTLTANNTYAGATAVNAGTLIVDGNNSLATGAMTVATGAALGGSGTIGGDLTLNNGARFAFAPGNTLTLLGSSTFALASSFGVASLWDLSGAALDWDTINTGTYTLLTGGNLGSNFFSTSNISNFGIGNAAANLGTGGTKSAYFQTGSLQLVVVPEPGSLALAVVGLGLGLAALAVRGRRRDRR